MSKVILSILVLALGATAQNMDITFKDGTECHGCDSIHRYTIMWKWDGGTRNGYIGKEAPFLYEEPYKHGKPFGFVKSYYPTGQLASSMPVGKHPEGATGFEWRVTGQLWVIHPMKFQKKDHWNRGWDNLMVLHGMEISFSEDGAPRFFSCYREGEYKGSSPRDCQW
jgi:hypothetical protein